MWKSILPVMGTLAILAGGIQKPKLTAGEPMFVLQALNEGVDF
jgi:hypothetical protein